MFENDYRLYVYIQIAHLLDMWEEQQVISKEYSVHEMEKITWKFTRNKV